MKNKKITDKQIHKYIEYFLKKIDKPYNNNIVLYFNNKCIRTNITFNTKTNQYMLEYGNRLLMISRSFENRWRYNIRYTMLHELGHIVHYTDKYELLEEKADAEYKAERFALNRLKENYNTTYVWVCKEGYAMLKDQTWAVCKTELHYRKAWMKIKEYN